VGRDGAFRRRAIQIGQLDLVAVGFGQQAADQRANLAGAQYEYTMHAVVPEK
jgi:hypothetical protein